MPRYSALVIMITLIAFAVVGRTIYIMTAERDYWTRVVNHIKRDSVDIKPMRGNILNSSDELMASSLPEFKVYMDFKTLHESKTDTLWDERIDSICQGLATIFPEKPASAFRVELKERRKEQGRH